MEKKVFFTNTYKAISDVAEIYLAPRRISQITTYTLKAGEKLNLIGKTYLASDSNVRFSTKYDGIFNLKGTGITKLQAFIEEGESGDIIFSSQGGSLIALEVDEKFPLTVDNGHIVAYSDNLNVNYRMEGTSWTSWLMSGEGYVCDFSGKGIVYFRSQDSVLKTVQQHNHYHSTNSTSSTRSRYDHKK